LLIALTRLAGDQSFLARFVKGFAGIAAIAATVVAFLTAAFENRRRTLP
jgi:hypothetical protein